MNPTDPTPAASHLPGSAPSENRQSPIGNRQSGAQRFLAYRRFWVLALSVFVADQATKFWINSSVPFDPRHSHLPDTQIEVIRGFFYIIHVGNTGAAWSMFSGFPVLLALLAAVTLGGIFFWRHSLGLRDRFTQLCFGLLCGGIVGNLLDRLLHGHVIDFIDLHFGSYIYPTFNVADSGICVGVIFYLWQSLRTPSGAKPEESSNK